MILGGLQRTTLIDFPGKIACTVFTVGCNFRCPFCHNKDLVSLEAFKKSPYQQLPEEEFFAFLEKRKEVLDGVCITGGEPTLQPDLADFCKKIKEKGLLVKLDSNGSRPEVLKALLEKKLVDFIAMDFKTRWEDYPKVTKFPQTEKIKESLDIILTSGLPYTIRTTIVPGIHDVEVLLTMARQLRKANGGKKIDWYWQNFQPHNTLDKKLEKEIPFGREEIEEVYREAKKIVGNIILIGWEG
ncbi:anaerobic ribonucleoside-triphosphate reductase activating protein [bacterium]|nr:anaerobic ribonucleoside-triphosphate reductase activating protein [bacterium]